MDGLANLSVIAARFQTAGRGQGTHTWLSPKDENLTFSILIRFGEDGVPVLPATEAVRISYIATLSIRDFLLDEGIESRIKWPNDIWVEDRKICGMLIENILDGPNVGCSIIGIGINILFFREVECGVCHIQDIRSPVLGMREHVPDLVCAID